LWKDRSGLYRQEEGKVKAGDGNGEKGRKEEQYEKKQQD
jgi:hypothetical protein